MQPGYADRMATTVLWRRLDLPGLDRCTVEQAPDGFRIAGTALAVVEGAPCEIRYSVLTGPGWLTHTVGAHVTGLGADRRLALSYDSETGWRVSDTPLIDLFGAVDVDFAWTPATNTLPIRRLGLEVGESAEVTVALIDFPGHDVSRSVQRYTRTSADGYRFESDDFRAELRMGPADLVAEYEDRWTALAWTGEEQPDHAAHDLHDQTDRASAARTASMFHSPENS